MQKQDSPKSKIKVRDMNKTQCTAQCHGDGTPCVSDRGVYHADGCQGMFTSILHNLKCPAFVWVNMQRGDIATPSQFEYEKQDLAELRQFYTREGAMALIKKHWPDIENEINNFRAIHDANIRLSNRASDLNRAIKEHKRLVIESRNNAHTHSADKLLWSFIRED